MNVVVVAGGPVADTLLAREAIASAERVIAADSGAEAALRLGRVPDLVVGDFDSLDPAVRTSLVLRDVEFTEYPTRKDRTDLHIALLAALDAGAESVTLLGLFGGERLDHGVAALLLLGREEFAGVRLRAIDGVAEMWVVRDAIAFSGEHGDYVTLVAITAVVSGVTTAGLEYPLEDRTLAFGDSLGVSNELREREARVAVRDGALLVVHQHGSSSRG